MNDSKNTLASIIAFCSHNKILTRSRLRSTVKLLLTLTNSSTVALDNIRDSIDYNDFELSYFGVESSKIEEDLKELCTKQYAMDTVFNEQSKQYVHSIKMIKDSEHYLRETVTKNLSIIDKYNDTEVRLAAGLTLFEDTSPVEQQFIKQYDLNTQVKAIELLMELDINVPSLFSVYSIQSLSIKHRNYIPTKNVKNNGDRVYGIMAAKYNRLLPIWFDDADERDKFMSKKTQKQEHHQPFYHTTDYNFEDISSEEYREYSFGYTIIDPLWLAITKSGSHRILDKSGTSHYVNPKDGFAIKWKAKDGQPKFVK